ncbi:30S ribosome-binding factor RbfA [Thermoflavifilum thermophilum]|uniref:Ribosome-binding factor A n=1 Tax=Thermoflavifilum thermophilum TaxID=1393122 RepID=A0A1I7N6I7_9BACT|nr:30S ribosome-binding factor RbfA [Thermoflavifilum thermophilum]SFV30290.1 ribosome-binding factor A [Thermoflavifilum thermophilum]
MQESKRQKQVARLIQEELSDIFQRQGLNIFHGGMISISQVKMTPDLLEARIYLSFYQITDPDQMLALIKDRKWEIKKELAARIKHQLRRIPELQFFRDDTLDYVFRLEEIFKKIHEQDKPADE